MYMSLCLSLYIYIFHLPIYMYIYTHTSLSDPSPNLYIYIHPYTHACMHTCTHMYTHLPPVFFQVVVKLEEGLTKRCTALAEQIQQGEPAAAERQAAVEGAMKELEAARGTGRLRGGSWEMS